MADETQELSVTEKVAAEIAAEIDRESPSGALKFLGDPAFGALFGDILKRLMDRCLSKFTPEEGLKVCQKPGFIATSNLGGSIDDVLDRDDFDTRRAYRREKKRIKKAMLNYARQSLNQETYNALRSENR